MARYEQDWCDMLAAAVGDAALGEHEPLRLLYVITDTDDGKVAFNIDLIDGAVQACTSGKLPRGEKADVTVTVKEAIIVELWAGSRKRDAAFMRGDVKIEGAYARWLDELVPLFESDPWSTAWAAAVD